MYILWWFKAATACTFPRVFEFLDLDLLFVFSCSGCGPSTGSGPPASLLGLGLTAFDVWEVIGPALELDCRPAHPGAGPVGEVGSSASLT